MEISSNEFSAPMAIEKIKTLGAVLELPAKKLIHHENEPNGLNWQCCLAGSSKTAPRIFYFFNCPRCRIFILCEIRCYSVVE